MPWIAASTTVPAAVKWLPEEALATVQMWNGTAWVRCPVKYWNGAAWTAATAVRYWNGTAWVSV